MMMKRCPALFTKKIDQNSKLSSDERASFRTILDEYDDVFDPNYTGYNGHVGPFEAVVNMGPIQPPQRKGHLPQYARNQLVELQPKFDEFEAMGEFVRPEDVPVNVEYLNPSFLIKKRSGGHRLVTAFSDVGRYSMPQPSLMLDVDGTQRAENCSMADHCNHILVQRVLLDTTIS